MPWRDYTKPNIQRDHIFLQGKTSQIHLQQLTLGEDQEKYTVMPLDDSVALSNCADRIFYN